MGLLCAALTLAAIFFRPVLPIDETRYLTVAWEMFLNHNYFLPTLNFEPYHHKPPLLFWLINLSWEIFGVHRWAAVLMVSIVSTGSVFLVRRLAVILFPEQVALHERLPWIMVASFPFLAMGTAIMFDFTLCLCVMLTWICAAKYLTTGKFYWAIPAGFFMGLGVLAKGPVVLLFTMLPFLLAPLWFRNIPVKKKHYGALAVMFAVGLAPVLFWLIPVFLGTSLEFFEWLVLKQTTGRMTGSFGGAHSRPFYFYAPVFIALFTPWIFFPAFWRGVRSARIQWRGDDILQLCFYTIVPAFLIFSIMRGKQAHYLIPMLPFVGILIAHWLEAVPLRQIKMVAIFMVTLLVAGQAIGSVTFFRNYDLAPIAEIIKAHPDKDWAYVRNYHGEVGFLARRKKGIEGLPDMAKLQEWFAMHPDGMAVIRYRDPEEIAPYNVLFTKDYSAKKHVSVITEKPEYP